MTRTRSLGIAIFTVLALGVVTASSYAPGHDALDVAVGTEVPQQPAVTSTTEATTTSTISSEEPAPPATDAPVAPAGEPAPIPTGANGDVNVLGERDPANTTVIPSSPGATSWSAAANGVQLTITASDGAPVNGTTVRFHVEAAASAGACCEFGFLTSDGTNTHAGDACTGAPVAVAAVDFDHVFNQAGHWEIDLYASAHDCAAHDNGYTVRIVTWIDVAAGAPPTGQGPSPPTWNGGSPSEQPGNPPLTLTTGGIAEDADGFVTSVVISWGDGTSDTFPGDGMGCQLTASGWPSHSLVIVPPYPAPYAAHTYAIPSEWTITVTVSSSGCDGSDVQQQAFSYQAATSF